MVTPRLKCYEQGLMAIYSGTCGYIYTPLKITKSNKTRVKHLLQFYEKMGSHRYVINGNVIIFSGGGTSPYPDPSQTVRPLPTLHPPPPPLQWRRQDLVRGGTNLGASIRQ